MQHGIGYQTRQIYLLFIAYGRLDTRASLTPHIAIFNISTLANEPWPESSRTPSIKVVSIPSVRTVETPKVMFYLVQHWYYVEVLISFYSLLNSSLMKWLFCPEMECHYLRWSCTLYYQHCPKIQNCWHIFLRTVLQGIYIHSEPEVYKAGRDACIRNWHCGMMRREAWSGQ